MESDLVQTRRTNLREWVAEHGTPTEEKSYFSQLISGGASFGERAARRLERDYQMGHLYLDRPKVIDVEMSERRPVPATRPAPEGVSDTVLMRLDARELQLLTWFRESDERGKQTIESVAELVEKPAVPSAGR